MKSNWLREVVEKARRLTLLCIRCRTIFALSSQSLAFLLMKCSGYSLLALSLLIAAGCGKSGGPRAEAVRAPATAGARAFKLARGVYRALVNEIHFKIIGKGDPSGAVTGARVVRAEITSTRLVNRAGQVVSTPKVTPYQPPTSALDISKADVAGLRVGVKGKDLEATVSRLFGLATRRKAGKNPDGDAATLVVNELRCRNLADGRHTPTPGTVCITAMVDDDDIVRSIGIERVFPFLDEEIFRKGLTQKYGPVASANGSGSGLSLGWGPELNAGQSGKYNALTANYATNDDFHTQSGNRIPDIRLTLRLVAAQWVSQHKQ